MIIHQYSIIAEARKSSGRRYDVFTHGNLGGGLEINASRIVLRE